MRTEVGRSLLSEIPESFVADWLVEAAKMDLIADEVIFGWEARGRAYDAIPDDVQERIERAYFTLHEDFRELIKRRHPRPGERLHSEENSKEIEKELLGDLEWCRCGCGGEGRCLAVDHGAYYGTAAAARRWANEKEEER